MKNTIKQMPVVGTFPTLSLTMMAALGVAACLSASLQAEGITATWQPTAAGVTVGTLAIDRDQRSGGVRIAEAIIYNNPLTEAERRQNIRYLLRKWRPEILPDHDLDLLLVQGGNLNLQVPTDQSVTVDTLN